MNLIENYLSTLKTIQNEDERLEFMLKAAPYIEMYENDTSDQKKDIFLEYLLTCHPHSETTGKIMQEIVHDSEKISQSDNCPECGSRRFEHVAVADLVCSSCGFSEKLFTQSLSFNDEQEIQKTSQYSYKRINHFNEWILCFQGLESSKIPTEVIDQVRNECKRQRLYDVTKISHSKVREILKKLGHNKYYEHSIFITSIVSGKNPPRLGIELEAKLRSMFNAIQEPFDKASPESRTNFLSYPYTLYKFVELLGEDEYMPYFPLLKSAEKLRAQDQIWRKICADLKWEFIPTI